MPLEHADSYRAEETAPHLAVAYVYVIEHADGTRIYYSNFDRELTLFNIPAYICPAGTAVFLPSQIKHGAVTSNDKFEERVCTLTLDSTDERLRRFFVVAAAVKLKAWIIRLAQMEITDSVDFEKNAIVVESGILSKFAFAGQTIAAEVTPEPYFVNFSIPRHYFQRQCNHPLYGPGCNLDKNAFAFTTTILAINSAERTLIIEGRKPGGAADYFEAGMFDHPATQSKYAIAWSAFEGASDTKLKLGYWDPQLAPGQALTAYAGCKHTVHDCLYKFGNGANYGGFPYVPNKNPVTNSP